MTAADWLTRAHAVTDGATRGPWHWAGNTDTGEPYLATWIPGAGRCQVLAIGHEDRSTTGRAAEEVRSYARECDADPDEFVQEWALDRYGEPVREPRLWLYEDLMAVNARDRVVYEVAPQATTRDDPRVYRADVSDIRHPDAAFIAASRTLLPAAVAAIEAVLALHRAVPVYGLADDCGCGEDDPDWDDHHFSTDGAGDLLCDKSPTGEQWCGECSQDADGDGTTYPCPTVAALDGLS